MGVLKLSSELAAEMIMISTEESDFVNKAERNTQFSSPHRYQMSSFPLIFFSIYNINDIYTNAVL